MILRLLAVTALIALAACAPGSAPSDAAQPAPTDAQAAPAAETPAGVSAGTQVADIPPPLPEQIETRADEFNWPQTQTRASIVTSKGEIVVELYQEQAPKTVANFLQYAREGHYDRLIFHRVVPGFVIQGGGFNQYLAERPTRAPVALLDGGAARSRNHRPIPAPHESSESADGVL